MLKALFPWKQNNTKKVLLAMEQQVANKGVAEETKESNVKVPVPVGQELPPEDLPLLPCHVCHRTFLPTPLKKHIRVCELAARKKRKPFDSLKQRVEGTDMEPFFQKTYLKKHHPEMSSQTQAGGVYGNRKQSKWKEKHLELMNTIRVARGISPEVYPSSPGTASTKKVTHLTVTQSSQNERCPCCDRTFGPKAFERHVEWCRQQKARLHKTPGNQIAKERLQARTKYVPPLKQTKRAAVRLKFSPSPCTPTVSTTHLSIPVVAGKSTPTLGSSRTGINTVQKNLMNSLDKSSENREQLSKARFDKNIGDCGDSKGAIKSDCTISKSFQTKRTIPVKKINKAAVNTGLPGIMVSSLNFAKNKKSTKWTNDPLPNIGSMLVNKEVKLPKLDIGDTITKIGEKVQGKAVAERVFMERVKTFYEKKKLIRYKSGKEYLTTKIPVLKKSNYVGKRKLKPLVSRITTPKTQVSDGTFNLAEMESDQDSFELTRKNKKVSDLDLSRNLRMKKQRAFENINSLNNTSEESYMTLDLPDNTEDIQEQIQLSRKDSKIITKFPENTMNVSSDSSETADITAESDDLPGYSDPPQNQRIDISVEKSSRILKSVCIKNSPTTKSTIENVDDSLLTGIDKLHDRVNTYMQRAARRKEELRELERNNKDIQINEDSKLSTSLLVSEDEDDNDGVTQKASRRKRERNHTNDGPEPSAKPLTSGSEKHHEEQGKPQKLSRKKSSCYMKNNDHLEPTTELLVSEVGTSQFHEEKKLSQKALTKDERSTNNLQEELLISETVERHEEPKNQKLPSRKDKLRLITDDLPPTREVLDLECGINNIEKEKIVCLKAAKKEHQLEILERNQCALEKDEPLAVFEVSRSEKNHSHPERNVPQKVARRKDVLKLKERSKQNLQDDGSEPTAVASETDRHSAEHQKDERSRWDFQEDNVQLLPLHEDQSIPLKLPSRKSTLRPITRSTDNLRNTDDLSPEVSKTQMKNLHEEKILLQDEVKNEEKFRDNDGRKCNIHTDHDSEPTEVFEFSKSEKNNFLEETSGSPNATTGKKTLKLYDKISKYDLEIDDESEPTAVAEVSGCDENHDGRIECNKEKLHTETMLVSCHESEKSYLHEEESLLQDESLNISGDITFIEDELNDCSSPLREHSKISVDLEKSPMTIRRSRRKLGRYRMCIRCILRNMRRGKYLKLTNQKDENVHSDSSNDDVTYCVETEDTNIPQVYQKETRYEKEGKSQSNLSEKQEEIGDGIANIHNNIPSVNRTSLARHEILEIAAKEWIKETTASSHGRGDLEDSLEKEIPRKKRKISECSIDPRKTVANLKMNIDKIKLRKIKNEPPLILNYDKINLGQKRSYAESNVIKVTSCYSDITQGNKYRKIDRYRKIFSASDIPHKNEDYYPRPYNANVLFINGKFSHFTSEFESENEWEDDGIQEIGDEEMEGWDSDERRSANSNISRSVYNSAGTEDKNQIERNSDSEINEKETRTNKIDAVLDAENYSKDDLCLPKLQVFNENIEGNTCKSAIPCLQRAQVNLDNNRLPKLQQYNDEFPKMYKSKSDADLKLPLIKSSRVDTRHKMVQIPSLPLNERTASFCQQTGSISSFSSSGNIRLMDNGTSVSQPTTPLYDPFESAYRQFMELIDNDDNISVKSSPFTQNVLHTPQNPRPHTSAYTTPKSLNEMSRFPKLDKVERNRTRASVIDPPSCFQDSLLNITADEEFELLESLANNNLELNDKFGFNLENVRFIEDVSDSASRKHSDDMSSIDPNLINEHDNLSIPENFHSNDCSPTSTMDSGATIQNFKPFIDSSENVHSTHDSERLDQIIKLTNSKLSSKVVLPSIKIDNVRPAPDGSSAEVDTKETSKKVARRPVQLTLSGNKNKSKVDSSASSIQKKNKKINTIDRAHKSSNTKNKEANKNGFDEGRNHHKISPKEQDIITVPHFTADELYSVDDEMYEEYKKYEAMYLRDKQKLANSRKVKKKPTDFGIVIEDKEKTCADSAYGSLNRKQQTKNSEDNLSPSPKRKDNTPSSASDGKVPKFCHECGSKYPLSSAKFCVECGVKRLVL